MNKSQVTEIQIEDANADQDVGLLLGLHLRIIDGMQKKYNARTFSQTI